MAGYEVDIRLIATILLGICAQHPRYTQRRVYFSQNHLYRVRNIVTYIDAHLDVNLEEVVS